MAKIYAFIVVFPFLAYILFMGIAFYEFDTKQTYLNDLTNLISQKVKITGRLTTAEYNDFKNKIIGFAKFEDSALQKGITMQFGQIDSNGNIGNINNYNLDNQLKKGDFFVIVIHSSSVSNYSLLYNWGVSTDVTQNIYYQAKSVCRVEEIL